MAAGKKCQNGTCCKECAAVIQGIAGTLFTVGEKIQEKSQSKEEDEDDEDSESRDPRTRPVRLTTFFSSVVHGPADLYI